MEHLYLWNLFLNSIWGKKGHIFHPPPTLTALVFLRRFHPPLLSCYLRLSFIYFVSLWNFPFVFVQMALFGEEIYWRKKGGKDASRVKTVATAWCSLPPPPGILSEEIKQIIILSHHPSRIKTCSMKSKKRILAWHDLLLQGFVCFFILFHFIFYTPGLSRILDDHYQKFFTEGRVKNLIFEILFTSRILHKAIIHNVSSQNIHCFSSIEK